MTVQVKISSLEDESHREPLQRLIDSVDLDQIYSGLEPDLVVDATKRTKWEVESVAKSMIGQQVLNLYIAQTSKPVGNVRLDISL